MRLRGVSLAVRKAVVPPPVLRWRRRGADSLMRFSSLVDETADRQHFLGKQAMRNDKPEEARTLLYGALKAFLQKDENARGVQVMADVVMLHLGTREHGKAVEMSSMRSVMLERLGDFFSLVRAELEHGRMLEHLSEQEGGDQHDDYRYGARKAFAKAADICSKHGFVCVESVQAKLCLGRLLLEDGEDAKAKDYIVGALKDANACASANDSSPELDEALADCHLSMASIHVNQGKHGAAEEHLRLGVRLSESVYGPLEGPSLTARSLLCCTLAALDKDTEASQIAHGLVQAARASKEGPYGYLTFAAIALHKAGDVQGARDAAALSVRLNHDDPGELEYALDIQRSIGGGAVISTPHE